MALMNPDEWLCLKKELSDIFWGGESEDTLILITFILWQSIFSK